LTAAPAFLVKPGQVDELSRQCPVILVKFLFGVSILNIRLFLARHGAGIVAHSGANSKFGEEPGI
jgi:hypothetical protein